MMDAQPAPNFGGPALGRPAALARPAIAAAPVTPVKAPAKVAARASYGTVPAGIPREWVITAAPNAWKWIVIHHSATTVGGAARFDREHREVRHFDELGYHFVVGNGTDTADGAVEVGSRWPKQKWGAHAQTPDEQFNKFGIGICLVGNFDQQQPSDSQLRATSKLVAYLMKTYGISPSHVIGHGDTKRTDCPGRNLHVASVRRMSVQLLVDAGDAAPLEDHPVRTAAANGEMMFKAPAR
jgi:N-acetylmuramoyl-L-alanine amidase